MTEKFKEYLNKEIPMRRWAIFLGWFAILMNISIFLGNLLEGILN